ncbi:MAG TPA: hydrogenase accessory protein HypB [Bdellovibrionales bacterium]|nr:MAG: hydrogenase accessory protein HypB [Bdellovibrionales bacterium GWB1_52_6]OFZ02813.1 MAG: hydrogenase accessory protein HypB [Bdellovibrionales bacterium GWA1_52_35]OFZ39651.1 MAG: hydrogenase accessory protein HypB [Bdellovibrionales bacterium GWC1_52_8]HAR42530.1 hydrogenase accessory protein HypB [Bdellovibrionales bacterium]HCM38395.1 hydrogenase accessory protein HypB [Bdellovibrionales bacterium]
MEIKLVKNVFEENETLAHELRKKLHSRGQCMVNFMSAPGSGKTRLLEKLIPELQKSGLKIGVIEGDITTTRDAERLQHLNIPIAQICTEFFGGDCHLAAHVVAGGYQEIEKEPLDIILLENVGNLVCPAEFDTGSDLNIVLLSVTEGEDKPLKYPLMFRAAHIGLINKIDLAIAAETNLPLLRKNMLQVNPKLQVLETSGKTLQGIPELAERIKNCHTSLGQLIQSG